MINQENRQLQMNFSNSDNYFKQQLDTGEFSIFFEFKTPEKKLNFTDSVSRIKDSINTVFAEKEFFCGVSVSEKRDIPESYSSLEFADALIPEEHRSKTLLYLCGRDKLLGELYENTVVAANTGFKNIIPVSGNAVFGESGRLTKKRTFTESIHLLKKVNESINSIKDNIFLGSTFNPFKYSVHDCLSQYFKLVKKINNGCNFIITQFGWDLLKAQEFRWYLTHRGLFYPSLEGIMFLTPDRVEKIIEGKYPGVHISPDFSAVLRNELRFSQSQFESAQWRRLQLQVAGAKLLGYSGVQLSGLDNPSKINIALKKIKEAFAEFKNFDYWRRTYREHLARVEMAPYPHRFYIFDNLFESAHLEQKPRMRHVEIDNCSNFEKSHYYFSKIFFSNAESKIANACNFVAKKIIAGCRNCKNCRLPQFHYICPENCPKGFVNGPCGGTKVNGFCEVLEKECIHAKRLRLANWRNNVAVIEELYLTGSKKKP